MCHLTHLCPVHREYIYTYFQFDLTLEDKAFYYECFHLKSFSCYIAPHSRCITRSGTSHINLLHHFAESITSLIHLNQRKPALCRSCAAQCLCYAYILCMCQKGHKTLLIYSHTLSSGFILCWGQISGLLPSSRM